eukprot:Hpha_TRINITY_DN12262_c1_g2::TRINITY_DN12262_c1_g2_i2::g.17074::m.17074
MDRGGNIDLGGLDSEPSDSPAPSLQRVPAKVGADVSHPDGAMRCVCADSRGVRTSMEDAHMIVIRGRWGFFGVFDGHAGSTCAAATAKTFAEAAELAPRPFTPSELEELCLHVDREWISRTTHENGAILDASGCTGTIAQVVADDSGAWNVTTVNVGDSRTLVSRGGRGEQLTQDHSPSLEQERARIRKAGGWVSGNRVDGMLGVSRSFGDCFFKQSELGERHHKVIAVPDITTPAALECGDRLFFCCDGVFEGGMTVQDVVDTHDAARSPRGHSAACAVVDAALGRGSQDNVSCLVVTLGKVPKQSGDTDRLVISNHGIDNKDTSSSKRTTESLSSPDLGWHASGPGGRAGRFERSDFQRFAAQQNPEGSPRRGREARRGSQPEAPRSGFAPDCPQPQSPPRHLRRRSGSASPELNWEGRNHHIVTLCRTEDQGAAAGVPPLDCSLSASFMWAAIDGGGHGWSTRPNGCASGIVLSGGHGEQWRRVRGVIRGSPGWRAGVRSGMDIIAVDGKGVSCLEAYEGTLRRQEGRQSIELTVRSDAAQWALIRRQALRERAISPSPAPVVPALFTQTIGGVRHKALENLQTAVGSHGQIGRHGFGATPSGLKKSNVRGGSVSHFDPSHQRPPRPKATPADKDSQASVARLPSDTRVSRRRRTSEKAEAKPQDTPPTVPQRPPQPRGRRAVSQSRPSREKRRSVVQQ